MRGKAQATPLTRIAVRALEKTESKLRSAPEAIWIYDDALLHRIIYVVNITRIKSYDAIGYSMFNMGILHTMMPM